MRFKLPRACSLLLGLGLPLACGGAERHLFSDDPAAAGDFLQGETASEPTTLTAASAVLTFPGRGTSGAAQPLGVGLGPETSTACDPTPAAAAPAAAPVQHVCFYAADDPNALAATIEQVLEVVGTEQWIHVRLTLSPDFVDNSYGQTAIGWGNAANGPPPKAEPPREQPAPHSPPRPHEEPAGAPQPAPADSAAPPPAPAASPTAPSAPTDGARPPAPAAGGPGAARPPGNGGPSAGGHSFRDLVGSDHAEIQLLDADGQIAMEFALDYLSASATAASGYASLGVSGGEGRISVGDPEWILASTSSMDRNLNACGLGSFVTDSPETDQSYTPNRAASDWDYRVAYEAWISTEAFAGAGFGSALIELVHASPSKHGGNSVNVLPAPCPPDPANPAAAPEPLPAALSTIR